MDRKKALNELLETAEYYHDSEHPDVPFHLVRPEMKEYIENHPLFEDYLAQETFNEGRRNFKHPHSNKVLGGAMTLGALLGAALAIKSGKPARLGDKVRLGLGGGIFGGGAGMISGGVGKAIMDERFRDREVGPYMTQAAWDIDDDLGTASDQFVNAKVPYEAQIQARNERLKQENMRHAVNSAATLGHAYLANQRDKKAAYVDGIEKLAEDKKRSALGVGAATGTGAAIGSLGHDVYKGANGTATAEGGKGIKAGLKSMAEGAGGKGKLAGNLLRQHGKSALIGGAVVGGLSAGGHALFNKHKKEATVLDVMLEKLAGKMDAVKSGVKKVMDNPRTKAALERLSFKKARVLQKNVKDYKKHKPGDNWETYAKHLGKARNKEVAKSVGAHAGIAATGAAAYAGSRRKKADEYVDAIEKLAGKMDAVKSGARSALNRLSFKKARDLQKEVKHSKLIGSKSNLKALKKNRNKEALKSLGAGAGVGVVTTGTAYGVHKKKSKMTKSASAVVQTVKSGAKAALDRLSFKAARGLQGKVKKMDRWKKLVPKKYMDKVKGERNKEALKSLGALGLVAKGGATAGVGAYAYGKHKKKMDKTAAEKKRSIGRDLASGARNAALLAAPVAAAVALKNKKALGVGKKLRSSIGEAIEKKFPKKVVEKAPGKLTSHLQKSEFGRKLLAGLDKTKSKIKGSKVGVKAAEKMKATSTSVKGGAALHGAIGAIKGAFKGTAKAVGDQFPGARKKVSLDKKKFAKIVGGTAVAGGVLKATKASKKEKEAASFYKHEIEKLAFSGFNSRQKARKALKNEWETQPVACR